MNEEWKNGVLSDAVIAALNTTQPGEAEFSVMLLRQVVLTILAAKLPYRSGQYHKSMATVKAIEKILRQQGYETVATSHGRIGKKLPTLTETQTIIQEPVPRGPTCVFPTDPDEKKRAEQLRLARKAIGILEKSHKSATFIWWEPIQITRVVLSKGIVALVVKCRDIEEVCILHEGWAFCTRASLGMLGFDDASRHDIHKSILSLAGEMEADGKQVLTTIPYTSEVGYYKDEIESLRAEVVRLRSLQEVQG